MFDHRGRASAPVGADTCDAVSNDFLLVIPNALPGTNSTTLNDIVATQPRSIMQNDAALAPLAPRFLRAGATLALMAASIIVGAAADAQAAEKKPADKSTPQLSIAIVNARESVSVGDPLSYTITVRNLGDTAVRGLRVTQTMPQGLEFTSADTKGVADQGQVLWKVDLKPSGTSRMHSAMTVSETPSQVLRLASVACGATAGSKVPVVCATNSAQLPAGAAAAEFADMGPVPPASGSRSWIGGVVGVSLVLVGAGTVLVRRRRTVPAGE